MYSFKIYCLGDREIVQELKHLLHETKSGVISITTWFLRIPGNSSRGVTPEESLGWHDWFLVSHNSLPICWPLHWTSGPLDQELLKKSSGPPEHSLGACLLSKTIVVWCMLSLPYTNSFKRGWLSHLEMSVLCGMSSMGAICFSVPCQTSLQLSGSSGSELLWEVPHNFCLFSYQIPLPFTSIGWELWSDLWSIFFPLSG